MQILFLAGLVLAGSPNERASSWDLAREHARLSQRCIKFSKRYAHGWLSHADLRTGLLPRNLRGDRYWNSSDCAADNFPFIALTAHIAADYHLERAAGHILEQEQRLTSRLDSLPDDFDLARKTFRAASYDLDRLIFGASEYAKDGLMPLTEWMGPGPWLERMAGLIRDIWKHARVDSASGKLPSLNVEVNGELLQTMARLYWITGDESYRAWTLRLADHYLLRESLLQRPSISLRDHGCEIIGGLSEACVLASSEIPERWAKYRPAMRALLDRILQGGVNQDGMMYNAFDPRSGRPASSEMSDGWGYVYNAFLTLAEIDSADRYRQAARHALANVHRYQLKDIPGLGGADGFADSIEGAINLLNRLPVASAGRWVDEQIRYIFERQGDDGIIEGWHGDGNSARTVLMYALWKTQGVTLAPWREDLELGAVRKEDGTLLVVVRSAWAWSGRLRFDRPRHRDVLHLPFDYPRINQFPEWFTVERNREYEIRREGQPARVLSGRELRDYELTLEPGEEARLAVIPGRERAARRSMRYTRRSPQEALAWQEKLRTELRGLLKLNDLDGGEIPLDPEVISSEDRERYTLRELAISSTPGRRMRVVLTIPRSRAASHPAVVCIHGHGGNRYAVHDGSSVYRGFAAALAANGAVTISADVGQHKVYEGGRTLMGERLWDLMRCVDYLQTLPGVDRSRIGCAGLSLGGEMAMWLGAVDRRIAATVSSGFLTTMDQMEENHCMCWKFQGLRDLVDYADIYSLIAPRPLQCQNGLREGPNDFCVPLARRAMKEIRQIYADLGRAGAARLAVHREGHVIDLPSLRAFFQEHLLVR